MKLELEVTKEEVEFLDDLLAESMEDGMPMDKLDEGMWIDPAENLLEQIRKWKNDKE